MAEMPSTLSTLSARRLRVSQMSFASELAGWIVSMTMTDADVEVIHPSPLVQEALPTLWANLLGRRTMQ